MYYRGFVEVCKVCHILGHIEFWRVDFVDVLAVYSPIGALIVAANLQRGAIVFGDPTLDEGEPVIFEPYPTFS